MQSPGQDYKRPSAHVIPEPERSYVEDLGGACSVPASCNPPWGFATGWPSLYTHELKQEEHTCVTGSRSNGGTGFITRPPGALKSDGSSRGPPQRVSLACGPSLVSSPTASVRRRVPPLPYGRQGVRGPAEGWTVVRRALGSRWSVPPSCDWITLCGLCT